MSHPGTPLIGISYCLLQYIKIQLQFNMLVEFITFSVQMIMLSVNKACFMSFFFSFCFILFYFLCYCTGQNLQCNVEWQQSRNSFLVPDLRGNHRILQNSFPDTDHSLVFLICWAFSFSKSGMDLRCCQILFVCLQRWSYVLFGFLSLFLVFFLSFFFFQLIYLFTFIDFPKLNLMCVLRINTTWL